MVGPFVDVTDGFTLEEAITVTNLTESLFKNIGAALPADLAANGTFDTDTGWTKGTNWQIDNGNNNLADQSSAAASDLSQTPATALVEGHAYEVVFTITNRTTGAIVCKIGGTSGTSRSTNATFTEIIIAGSGALIEFTADGTWDGELDTVTYELSHIERTPSTNDMVFADGGTYYKLLSVTDTIILGDLSLVFEDVSDLLPRREEFEVISASQYDFLYGTDGSVIADAVWNEAKSGHVTAGTFGELGHLIIASGVVETSGSNSSTQVQTNLSEATNDHYDVMTILFTSGAEAGQSRLITGYVGATGVVSWNAALSGTPADDVTFVILSAGTTADAVWDEILTGSSHNISTSAGKRLRQIEETFVHASGTIATVTDGHTFTLDSGAVDTGDYYAGDRLQIIEGTGAGQTRIIVGYTSGRVATLDSDFVTNPDTASLYAIDAADVHVGVSDSDLAGGFVAVYTNTTTITLDAAAVATGDYYVGELIIFTHGTGAGQAREITAYTSGRVVTMSPALTTALDTTTTWHIQAVVSIPEIVLEMWDEAMAETTGAPAITGSMRLFMQWWAGLSRNKMLQTATTSTLRNDADDGDLATSTVSDNGTTFTRGEWST